MFGEIATKWTVRLALLCYAAYLAGALTGHNGRLPRTARGLWTVGCGLFLAHVACAFHFYHGWSHAAAFETTARETEALLGIPFGEGIYFSYLFTGVWVLDVVRLWITPLTSARTDARLCLFSRQGLCLTVHVYLLFIAMNGAIVFEAGVTRWGGLIVCGLLMGLLVARAYNVRQGHSPEAAMVSSGREPRDIAPCDSSH